MNNNIKTIIEKIKAGEPLTSDEKKKYILYSFCTAHTGKMQGMQSVSTSCIANKYCDARRKVSGTVCEKCYAAAMMKQYNALSEKLLINTLFYNRYKLEKADIPTITVPYFRFEAFGDIQTELQLQNYYTIARKNSHVRFALWTKNDFLLDLIPVKPRNVIAIYSEPVINKEWTVSQFELFQKYHKNIDKVFIVFDKEYTSQYGTNINCGARSCFTCRKCYSKKRDNRIIRELLK